MQRRFCRNAAGKRSEAAYTVRCMQAYSVNRPYGRAEEEEEGIEGTSREDTRKTGGTHVFNISLVQGLDILPHRCRERMVRTTPSSVRQKLLIRVVAREQRELGNPQKVRGFRYLELALSVSEISP